MKSWSVYIVECVDGSFYTGITEDIDNRLRVHNAGKGAKYTRGRRPVILRYVEKMAGKSEALKRENEIKGLKKSQKMRLW